MKIIQGSTKHVEESYGLSFKWYKYSGGYNFSCDKDGNVDVAEFSEQTRYNYIKCTDGTYDVENLGVQTYKTEWILCAVGLCECGEEVDLINSVNDCFKCDREYNLHGQELEPSTPFYQWKGHYDPNMHAMIWERY
jgi:hypothetical protein